MTTTTTTPEPTETSTPNPTELERIQARWDKTDYIEDGPRDRANAAMLACAAGAITYADFDAVMLKEEVADTKLQLITAQRPTGPAIHAPGGATDKKVIEAMILCHSGRDELAGKTLGDEATQTARQVGCTSMLEIMRASFRADGRDVPGSTNELIRAAFASSTLSLPTALGNTANKVAMDAYQQAPATWRAFAAIKSANDFKTHTGIRITDMGGLSELGRNGEIEHGTLDEATYPYSLSTYAKQLRISRQNIIDDDLGVFDDAAQGFGRTAARRLNDLVYTVLLANGGSFYATANNNFISGGATNLQSSSLETALTSMRQQTDADGAALDLVPRVLLVPPELEQTAKALIDSDLIQLASTASGPTGNTFKNLLQLEIEARLSNDKFTGYSALAWYLFASSQDASIIVAFLNGQQSPTIEFFGLDSDPNTLGVSWRVFHDFGVALADPKATVKSKGEA